MACGEMTNNILMMSGNDLKRYLFHFLNHSSTNSLLTESKYFDALQSQEKANDYFLTGLLVHIIRTRDKNQIRKNLFDLYCPCSVY